MIQDGACIGINSFLALANPNELHSALARRFLKTGHPKDLTLYCASGFGGWSDKLFADQYIQLGAVKKIIASHFMSMPTVLKMVSDNKLECYCMPLGVLSHLIRASASG
ncbi:MAG: hypothetical protein FWH46_06240, partial [Methanimicrococcus sp.]|nr:hypothetical protein [Methanimicrococcus sp.]